MKRFSGCWRLWPLVALTAFTVAAVNAWALTYDGTPQNRVPAAAGFAQKNSFTGTITSLQLTSAPVGSISITNRANPAHVDTTTQIIIGGTTYTGLAGLQRLTLTTKVTMTVVNGHATVIKVG